MTTDSRDHHISSIPFTVARIRWHASIFSTIVHEIPGAGACVAACLPPTRQKPTPDTQHSKIIQEAQKQKQKQKTLASHGCSPRAYSDAPPYSLGIWSLSIFESNVWYTLAAVQDVICQKQKRRGAKARTARTIQCSTVKTGAPCARRTGVRFCVITLETCSTCAM